jgi:arylformamidase
MDELLFSDVRDLEREYSPSSAASDFAASVASYRSRSDESLRSFSWRRLFYGDTADEFVMLTGDFERAHQVHLFIHGGYWQELSWRDALFPAAGFVEQGHVYGAINYTLAPQVSLDQIVDQCRRAVLAVVRAAELEGASLRLSLSGSSAGAHLAAMMALTDWSSHGLLRNPVSALVLLSGVYALRPLIQTSVNNVLGLDQSDADRLSPLLLQAPKVCPAIVAWGQYETRAFKRQSAAFASYWRASANPVEALEIAGRSHFDIVFDLADRTTLLGHRVRLLLRRPITTAMTGGGIDVG